MKSIFTDIYMYIYNFRTRSSIYSDDFSNVYFSTILIGCVVFGWGCGLLQIIEMIGRLTNALTFLTKVTDVGVMIPFLFFLAIVIAAWSLFAFVFNKKVHKLRRLPKYNGAKAKIKGAIIVYGPLIPWILCYL